MLYTNINERYGDPVSFRSLHDLEQAIQDCGYKLPSDGLEEGVDYVVSEEDYVVSEEKAYNGWSNWATWEAYNVLTGYEENYRAVLGIMNDYRDNIQDFEIRLRDIYLDMACDAIHAMDENEYCFVNIGLVLMRDQINWRQLANSFWEDREEEGEE